MLNDQIGGDMNRLSIDKGGNIGEKRTVIRIDNIKVKQLIDRAKTEVQQGRKCNSRDREEIETGTGDGASDRPINCHHSDVLERVIPTKNIVARAIFMMAEGFSQNNNTDIYNSEDIKCNSTMEVWVNIVLVDNRE